MGDLRVFRVGSTLASGKVSHDLIVEKPHKHIES